MERGVVYETEMNIVLAFSDLHRQLQRLSVPYSEPVNHPQKTVNAMRMLAAISNDSTRELVSHALYKVW